MFLEKIIDFASGGFIKEIVNGVKAYFPPSMSDKEKSDLEMAIVTVANDHQIKLLNVAHEAEVSLTERVKELEGTAADLKTIPVLGPLMIFVRGCQRPIWGLATLYFDYLSFIEKFAYSDRQEMMLFTINILVLGFLFGERAAANIIPILGQYFNKKLPGA